MAEISINGVLRTEFGKGASRRARRDGLVPAVIYGHGEKPQHITLPARELGVALKQSNVLLDISIDGKTELTLPKAIVRHPLKQILEHVDLVLVRRGEKVVVAVPVHTVGEHNRDGILEHVHNSIEVRVEATAIPSFLEVDIEGMVSGESRYASDVKLPAGVELESDPKTIVVHVSERSTIVEEVVAPVVAATDAAAPAEDAEKKDA
ncbi:50S ribosomal protein L25 [Actinomycetes bacterium]|nr:50S ribosomal protein L25 [Actinomycetota bacterium]GDX21634.1 50S ribosomal protein L25 [Actinomycetes bacterium]